MKKRNKRTPILNRKRAALRRLAAAVIVMLLVNHIMHIGLLLPRQAYHKLEERAGVGWTRVIKRDWVPEIHKTHIAYLSGDDAATLFGSVHWSIYGWMPAFHVSLDCSKDSPLYAGRSFMSRDEDQVWYFFGRVDDPTIKSVAISLCAEEYDDMSHAYIGQEVRRITAEELIERDGHRYFFLQDDGTWDREAHSSPRSVVIGYDREENEVVRLDIEAWNFSNFG